MVGVSHEVNSGDLDIDRIRRDIYLGPGYHVVRGYLSPSRVDHIHSFWQTHRNPQSGTNVPVAVEGCPLCISCGGLIAAIQCKKLWRWLGTRRNR